MPDVRNGDQTSTARVRRAQVTDAPTLARLNKVVQDLHVALYPKRFEALREAEKVQAFFTTILQQPDQVVGICESAQGAIAYIWLEEQVLPASPFTKASTQLYIHHLTVERHAREQGVATKLLNWALQHARERGIGEVALDHWDANSGAHRFFGGRGFKVERVIMRRAVPEAP